MFSLASTNMLQRLVEQQLRNAYIAVADLASTMEGQGAEAAIQAHHRAPSRRSQAPTRVAPSRCHIRPILSVHPKWQWNTEFIKDNPRVPGKTPAECLSSNRAV